MDLTEAREVSRIALDVHITQYVLSHEMVLHVFIERYSKRYFDIDVVTNHFLALRIGSNPSSLLPTEAQFFPFHRCHEPASTSTKSACLQNLTPVVSISYWVGR
jgi:hypothetical protein